MTTVQSQDNTTEENTTSPATWSDPATWPDETVPSQGDDVTITKDMNVTLDVSPPQLASITIDGGTLRFARQDINLTAGTIMARDKGEFRIGTEQQPFEHKAVITLTGTRDDLPGNGHCGVKGLCAMGAKLAFHGAVSEPTWTQLDATASQGDTTITVNEAVDWDVGDEIVILSTDYDPGMAEQRRITDITGNTIQINDSLDFMHFGEELTYGGKTIDERGEVIHLTRNIVIQGDEQSEDDNFGGHIMAMNQYGMEQERRHEQNGDEYYNMWQSMENNHSLVPEISGVEMHRMGQEGVLARYPFHWHKYGNASGSYIEDSSIHDSYQRCVTLHGTQHVRVKNTVGFNVIGHCYFLEDGTEWNNTIRNNVAALVKPFTQESRELIPNDNEPAGFWWSNVDNTFINNVAGGVYGYGFHLEVKEYPTGPTATNQLPINSPQSTEGYDFGTFSGNTAHSIAFTGRTPLKKLDTSQPDITVEDFPERSSGGVGMLIDSNLFCGSTNFVTANCRVQDFTVYQTDRDGIWTDSGIWFDEIKSAGNPEGYWPRDMVTSNSVFVGYTPNTGNPGRSGQGRVSESFGGPGWQVSQDGLHQKENELGRSLGIDQVNTDKDPDNFMAAVFTHYDGGSLRDSSVHNYKTTSNVNAGLIIPNGQTFPFYFHNVTLDNVSITYPISDRRHDKTWPLVDYTGTFDGSGTYTEYRHVPPPRSSPIPFFIDDTCTSYADDWYKCSSRTARWRARTNLDIAVNNTSNYVPLRNTIQYIVVNRTYHLKNYDSLPTFQLNTFHEGDWIIFTLPTTEQITVGGPRVTARQVPSMSQLKTCDADAEVCTYYDGGADRQHFYIRGTASYNNGVYDRLGNGNKVELSR
jgi:hypothetical protein